jgi:hypothetical protein
MTENKRTVRQSNGILLHYRKHISKKGKTYWRRRKVRID